MAKPSASSAKISIPSPTPTERVIASLWKEVLRGGDRLLPHDNFFALGGDVLTAARLELRIEDEFPVALRPGTVRDAPTLRELSSSVDRQVEACRVSYARLMAEPPPKDFDKLLERGMPGAPGILGDPDFIARAMARAKSH